MCLLPRTAIEVESSENGIATALWLYLGSIEESPKKGLLQWNSSLNVIDNLALGDLKIGFWKRGTC